MPHAALLIDFDNVTLGIRSDLTKELKTLLNSDIIRGKVAVQRAYADWRRYPQYIVPLSERSIDLIFATAVGSTKKNATDIRLAIDAMELVFTRPEIGTFILLSGDSDFSSLVIKLKEYGKYVIGVGIRESASDLLIQNCDEYYSYSELAGLQKEDDAPSAQRDPWELAREAVAQMARQGDVMRSDRLKQVMQQIDPNFDERNAGFNRFSKFVIEAGNRGLVRLSKLDNGQYEVAPAEAAPAAPAAPTAAVAEPKREAENGRRGRRGRRGDRERDRDKDRDREKDRGQEAGKPKSPPGAPGRTGSKQAPPAKAERRTRSPSAPSSP
ncbi:MAG: NYN domain-containing protein [Gemmatimonadales bacterium]